MIMVFLGFVFGLIISSGIYVLSNEDRTFSHEIETAVKKCIEHDGLHMIEVTSVSLYQGLHKVQCKNGAIFKYVTHEDKK